MIQGGDPLGTGMSGPGYVFQDEFHPSLSHVEYAVSMANSGPLSNGSQFFINLSDNYFLDDGAGYCVFGKVIEGHEVVKTIGNLSTHVTRGMGDVPIKTVTINSIKISN